MCCWCPPTACRTGCTRCRPARRADRTPVVSLDQTRQLADLALDGVPARPVVTGPDAAAAVRAALTAGAAMLAVRAARAGREVPGDDGQLPQGAVPVRPAGRLVPGAQAPAGRSVGGGAQARAAARYAAACLAEGDPDTPVAVALAKAACGDAATLAAQECVQLHGGIGFTWEHPAHLYLKRAKSASTGFGTPDWHRGTLASLADLRPGPGRRDEVGGRRRGGDHRRRPRDRGRAGPAVRRRGRPGGGERPGRGGRAAGGRLDRRRGDARGRGQRRRRGLADRGRGRHARRHRPVLRQRRDRAGRRPGRGRRRSGTPAGRST